MLSINILRNSHLHFPGFLRKNDTENTLIKTIYTNCLLRLLHDFRQCVKTQK